MTTSRKIDIVLKILSIVIFIFQVSCEKAGVSSTDINVVLKNTETYSHYLGYMAKEECISIYIDAQHASSSTILGGPFEPKIYEYIPDSNYVGYDRAVIRIEKCVANKKGVIVELNHLFQIIE